MERRNMYADAPLFAFHGDAEIGDESLACGIGREVGRRAGRNSSRKIDNGAVAACLHALGSPLAEAGGFEAERTLRGELLVAAPFMFGKLHVAPIVHAFIAAYPEETVRLVLSDDVIDLVEADVDFAVRIGQLAEGDLIARQVGRVRST